MVKNFEFWRSRLKGTPSWHPQLWYVYFIFNTYPPILSIFTHVLYVVLTFQKIKILERL